MFQALKLGSYFAFPFESPSCLPRYCTSGVKKIAGIIHFKLDINFILADVHVCKLVLATKKKIIKKNFSLYPFLGYVQQNLC